MKADIYNLNNEKTGTMEIPEAVFGAKWNPALVKQVIEAIMSNKRQPWAHAKGRGEVRGGGRKPWRQKGTGRARHGSIRSPLWPGGGVSHGPKKERDFYKKVNKKMKKAALFSALSKKFKEAELRVIDNLEISEPKTKLIAGFLKNFNGQGQSFLIIPKAGDKKISRAAANLPRVKTLPPNSLNVFEILKCKTILLDKAAAETIKETYAK